MNLVTASYNRQLSVLPREPDSEICYLPIHIPERKMFGLGAAEELAMIVNRSGMLDPRLNWKDYYLQNGMDEVHC